MSSRTCSTKEEMFTVLEFKWMLAGQINERVCHFLGTLTSKTTKFLNLVKQKGFKTLQQKRFGHKKRKRMEIYNSRFPISCFRTFL